jgi:DNA-binding NarL/FixJ family response regulator
VADDYARRSYKLEGPIRVLLADDHAMFRQGIRHMLETDPQIEVVGEGDNGVEAIALARQTEPDVIFLDVEMPMMGGEEALKHLLRISSSPRIVILTMHASERLVRSFLAQGASGYMHKGASIEELREVVHNAVKCPRSPKGDNAIVVVPPDMLERVEAEEAHITARELEILILAARGLTNYQIAKSLFISEGTVKRHLSNLYRKRGVNSRWEAVEKALSEQWLTIQDII